MHSEVKLTDESFSCLDNRENESAINRNRTGESAGMKMVSSVLDRKCRVAQERRWWVMGQRVVHRAMKTTSKEDNIGREKKRTKNKSLRNTCLWHREEEMKGKGGDRRKGLERSRKRLGEETIK